VKLSNLDDPIHGRFSLEDGERAVLLGKSGAGKTRVVKALLGLHGPVLFRRGSPVAKICAYVPQSDGVFLDLTALQNVSQPAVGVTPLPAGLAQDWLDLVGLAAYADVPTSALSMTQRRRISLARALSRELPLLIIDGDLDPTLAALLPGLLETVRHLSSVLTTSCAADSYAWTADTVGLVEDCRVIGQGSMAELVESLDPAVRGAVSWTLR
jgi:ABC-type multidrug transport system ATPase subunit